MRVSQIMEGHYNATITESVERQRVLTTYSRNVQDMVVFDLNRSVAYGISLFPPSKLFLQGIRTSRGGNMHSSMGCGATNRLFVG